ncbi:MAG: response regulator [Elusimicrobiota bacterium]
MKKNKMLIIDDEVTLCELVKGFFEENDYEVHMAHTAMDGVKSAEQIQPDIILLDVDLPDKSGLQLTELGKMFNVIIISGKVDVTEEIVRKVMHAFCYMKKPFDMSKLYEKVDFVLNKENALNPKSILKALYYFKTLETLYTKLRLDTGIFFTPQDMVRAIEESIFQDESRKVSYETEKQYPRYDRVEGLPIGAYKEWYKEHGEFTEYFEEEREK